MSSSSSAPSVTDGSAVGSVSSAAAVPVSPSRSSSTSSDDSGSSSPLLASQPHKPRPLQLESDDGGGAALVSEAQSPLYYVPQHLLFTPHTSHHSHSAAGQSGPAFFTQQPFAYSASAYSPSPSPIHLGAYPRSSAYGFSSHLPPLTPTSGHHGAAAGSPVSFVPDGSSLAYGSSPNQPHHVYMSGLVPSPNHAMPSPAFTFSPLPGFSSSPLPLSPLSELSHLQFASLPSPSHGSSTAGVSSAADASSAYFQSAAALSASTSSFPFSSSAAAAHYLSRDNSAHSVSSGSPTSVHSAPPSAASVGGGGMLDGSYRPSSSSSASSHHPRSFGSPMDLLPSVPPSAHSHPGGFSSSPPLLSAFSQLALGHSPAAMAGVPTMFDASYAMYSPQFGSSMPAMSNNHIASQPAMMHSSARLTLNAQHPQQQQQQQHYQYQQQHPYLGQPHHHPHQQQQQQQRGGHPSRSRPVAGPFAQSALNSSSALPAHLSGPAQFQPATRRGTNGAHQSQPTQPFGAASTAERGRGANGYNSVHAAPAAHPANAANRSKSPLSAFSSLSAPLSALSAGAAAQSTAALPFAANHGQSAQSNLSWTASSLGGPSVSPSPPPAATPAQPAVSSLSSHSLPLPLSSVLASSSGRVSPSPPSLLTVESLVGHVVRLCKTHTGSRFIQQKLEQRDVTYFNVLFSEMAASIVELACDNFGSVEQSDGGDRAIHQPPTNNPPCLSCPCCVGRVCLCASVSLCLSVFVSHFAVERLLTACSVDQVSTLLSCIAPYFNAVAVQKHGTSSTY